MGVRPAIVLLHSSSLHHHFLTPVFFLFADVEEDDEYDLTMSTMDQLIGSISYEFWPLID